MLVYLLIITIFTPAMANQYLAIPVEAVAAFPNVVLVIWLAMSSLFLIGDVDGMGIAVVRDAMPAAMNKSLVGARAYDLLVLLLAFGALTAVWLRTRAKATDQPCPPSHTRTFQSMCETR